MANVRLSDQSLGKRDTTNTTQGTHFLKTTFTPFYTISWYFESFARKIMKFQRQLEQLQNKNTFQIRGSFELITFLQYIRLSLNRTLVSLNTYWGSISEKKIFLFSNSILWSCRQNVRVFISDNSKTRQWKMRMKRLLWGTYTLINN